MKARRQLATATVRRVALGLPFQRMNGLNRPDNATAKRLKHPVLVTMHYRVGTLVQVETEWRPLDWYSRSIYDNASLSVGPRATTRSPSTTTARSAT